MLFNNIVIVFNGKVFQLKIINYYYLEKEFFVLVEVGVYYNLDLEFVEQVILEVVNQVLFEYKWGVEIYEFFVVYYIFDNFSINFIVMFCIKEYFNCFFVKFMFIKVLYKCYQKEGIVIFFFIIVINLQ